MADDACRLHRPSGLGKRLFWYTAIDDEALLALYRNAYASVLPSHYEGYGLPAVEALTQGCVTIASDAGSLPESAAGHAVIFPGGDGEALSAILDGSIATRTTIRGSRPRRGASGRRLAGSRRSGKAALADIGSGAAHDFAAALRQMVYLSTNPEILDLSLQSGAGIVPSSTASSSSPSPKRKAAIDAVARRHFAGSRDSRRR